VEPDAIFVTDGPVVTSAGITAGTDLTLALVEDDHGATLARDAARSLVVFLQRPGGQSQFSVPARIPVPDSDLLRRVIDAVAADPAGSHTVPGLAAAAGTSTRQLTRLFRSQLGTTGPVRRAGAAGARADAARQRLLGDVGRQAQRVRQRREPALRLPSLPEDRSHYLPAPLHHDRERAVIS
jgi:transcriptional regulator GlxA family with amidase domain